MHSVKEGLSANNLVYGLMMFPLCFGHGCEYVEGLEACLNKNHLDGTTMAEYLPLCMR